MNFLIFFKFLNFCWIFSFFFKFLNFRWIFSFFLKILNFCWIFLKFLENYWKILIFDEQKTRFPIKNVYLQNYWFAWFPFMFVISPISNKNPPPLLKILDNKGVRLSRPLDPSIQISDPGKQSNESYNTISCMIIYSGNAANAGIWNGQHQ